MPVNFPCVIQKTEKRQTSQGYIIRILQHFATKLWNITSLRAQKLQWSRFGPAHLNVFISLFVKLAYCTVQKYDFDVSYLRFIQCYED